jgi:hypothetical protein
VTPTQLEQTFRGSIATWSGLSSSGSCGNPINRVVPNDSVGTTYPFKHYLATINSAVVHNGSTWSELQSTSTSATWPNPTTVTKSQSGCATVMSLQCPGGLNSGTTGDDDEVRTVGATSGSIGFGALGSARAVYATTTHTNFKWIGIHSAFGGTINPSTNGLSATTGRSNCNETVGAYSPLPAAGATGTWSTTYMTNPGSTYPLCALTWDLALTQYAPHWGPTGASTARTAHDYLQYVLRTGQAVASFLTHDYALTANLTEVGTTGVQEITG